MEECVGRLLRARGPGNLIPAFSGALGSFVVSLGLIEANKFSKLYVFMLVGAGVMLQVTLCSKLPIMPQTSPSL